MELKYHGHANKPGIYKITNLTDGKVYIGSTVRFKRRAKQHLNSLEKGVHQNKHLQRAFDRDGTDAFVFEVVEVVLGDKLARTTVEQTYLDQYLGDWERCYNFKKKTKSEPRSCYSNTPEVTRLKKSIAAKRAGIKPPVQIGPKTSEHVAKISEGVAAFWQEPENREKMLAAFANRRRGYAPTEEHRARLSAAGRAHHAPRKAQQTKLLYEVFVDLGSKSLNRELHEEYVRRGGVYALETARRQWAKFRKEETL